MIPINVIRCALGGGWEPFGSDFTDMSIDNREVEEPNSADEDASAYDFVIYDNEYPDEGYFCAGSNFRTALDPNFWQGLGNYLGWPKENGAVEIFEKNRASKKASQRFETRTIPLWRHHAFELFHLVLTDGDTERYWRELTSDTKEAS